jgi:hypothetical protein
MTKRNLCRGLIFLGFAATAVLLIVAFCVGKSTLLGPAAMLFTLTFGCACCFAIDDPETIHIFRKNWAPRDLDSVLRSNGNDNRDLETLSLSAPRCSCRGDLDAALRGGCSACKS